MEKSTKIVAQVYGYAICLVAVITFLFTVITLVTAVIDLQDPLQSGWTTQGQPSLASYENYKADVLKSFQKDGGSATSVNMPSEQSIKAMYEASKNEKIETAKHQANKTILVSSLMIAISIALFVTHWSWMQRLARSN